MSLSKERPILFSAPMVRAILEGRKTQTRRIVKPRKDLSFGCVLQPNELAGEINNGSYPNSIYGQPGDRLWVRETWGVVSHCIDDNGDVRKWKPDRPATSIHEMPFGKGYYSGHAIYRADGEFEWRNDYGDEISAWKPSIHMPRLASRIDLEITGVRVERLQDIKKQDSFGEGIQNLSDGDYYEFGIHGLCSAQHPVRAYQLLWESINGTGSWDKNPWVWVIEFKRIEA